MKLNQYGLYIVQIIGQYELIITYGEGVKDHVNGKVLIKYHIELFAIFPHASAFSTHESIEIPLVSICTPLGT